MDVLNGDGLVETKLDFKLVLLRRADHPGGVEQDIGDVAWNDAQQNEDDYRNAEQRDYHEQQSADQVTPHHLSSQTSSYRASL
jgi:hypothetical protein